MNTVHAILKRSVPTVCETCDNPAFRDTLTGRVYCGNKCNKPETTPAVYAPGPEWALVHEVAENGHKVWEHQSGIYQVALYGGEADGAAEILTLQKGPNGVKTWEPATNPCQGRIERVVHEAERRAAWIAKQQAKTA